MGSPSADDIARLKALLSADRLMEAEVEAREMIQAWPRHEAGWQALAVILGTGRRYAEALPVLQKMLEAWPANPETYVNLGNTMRSLDRHAEAVAYYRSALSLVPASHAVHYALADTLKGLRRLTEAEESFRCALELKPDYFEAHGELGNVLWDQARLGEAEASMRRAISLRPHSHVGHGSLGGVLRDQGRYAEAEASCRHALELKPDFHQAHNNLGNTLCDLGRFAEAEASYRRALEILPDYADVYSNLANALYSLGRFLEAEAMCRRALELKPDLHDAHNNLGNTLQILNRFTEAAASCRRAVELKPDFHQGYNNLGNALVLMGDPSGAEVNYRRALKLKPDYCLAYSNLLFCLSHNELVGARALLAEHSQFAQKFEGPLRAGWPRHTNVRDPERKLRIGFVSADLRDHAVAFFLEPALAQLAGNASFFLHAYSNSAFEDAVTRRLRGTFANWHCVVGLSDEAFAEQVRADGIDILIDLSGHSAANRLLTFARKPAPVQASWIGYPGTTGLSAMDYYLADPFFLPHEQFDWQFTEKIVHLPAGVPFQPFQGAPLVNALPALKNGYLTFGSFNRQSKISSSVIGQWSRLLQALPDSRLVLGGLSQDGKHEALTDHFAREGIGQERLSFYPRCGMADYLALHLQVDLCLDTIAYTGGTTTLHGLWMGVPTLTIAGETAPRRQGAAILGHVGLEAFVARDGTEFVQKGLHWSGNLRELERLRAGLRKRFAESALGQPALVAEGLAQALRSMWQRWCAGQPPEPSGVTNLQTREVRLLGAEEHNSAGILRLSQGDLPGAEASFRRALELNPDNPDAHNNRGNVLLALADRAAAETSFRRVLELKPDAPEAHNNLGVVLSDLGRSSEAERSFRRALELKPDYHEALSNFGNLLRNVGRPESAENCYRRALEIKPESAEAHNNLGNALVELRRLPEAEASYRRALEIRRDYHQAHNNIGVVLGDLGRLPEAEASLRRAVQLYPDYHEAHNNLGNVLRKSGRLSEAEAAYRRALALRPDYHEAHNNLGNALADLGRPAEAETSYLRSLKLKPDTPQTLNNIGVLLGNLGRLAEAETRFCRALELNPDYREAHSNLGTILGKQGRIAEAVANCRRAVELGADFHEGHNNLGNVLLLAGDLPGAEASYRRALEIKPDERQTFSNLLFGLSHNEQIGAETLFAVHRGFGQQLEAPLRTGWVQHANTRNPDRMLHVGFVSADLRDHAVAYFIEPLLAQLAGSPRLSLHAYSNNPIEDNVTKRLREHLGHWNRASGVSDDALADKIRADGIDILIDLSGHTGLNRLATFAHKPAPVQASWIGYPGTTGLSAMDYYFADRFFLPRGQLDAQFTEKIVHLPASVPFQPFEGAPAVNVLPALKNGYVTFGSFNRRSKISASVIKQWCRLLQAMPGSRMLLGGLHQAGEYEALTSSFAREGIAPERLSFHARCGMEEYLALHRQVDLCLDTFAYNGGTTTFHALWMGVPTLTIAGETAPRRQGAAILGHVGLEAFIARDEAEFVQKGVHWAGKPRELGSLRAGLRKRFAKSALGQPELVAAGLERALRIMWQRWCANLPPESFDVSDAKRDRTPRQKK